MELILYRRYKKLKQFRLNLSEEHLVKLNGFDFKIMPNDKGISAELLMFGIHEPLTTKILSQYLEKGMICIDMGSNIGYYAVLECNLVGEKGKVIAIEASPQNYKYLKKNLEMQKYSNMETHNLALSDSNGLVKFLVRKQSNLSKVVENDQTISSDEEIIDVQSKKLDSFLEQKSLDHVDFLRMDVEGHEFKIYKGMQQTIRKYKPILLMELHKYALGIENLKKFLTLIKNDGYELQYYIDRALDEPILAKDEYIEKMNIDELYHRIEKDFLPGNFTLLLTPIKT